VSPRTEAVILKATQLRPADRYQTIADMRAALIPAAAQPARPADPLGAFIRLLFGRP
jgi:hypothetical protein